MDILLMVCAFRALYTYEMNPIPVRLSHPTLCRKFLQEFVCDAVYSTLVYGGCINHHHVAAGVL